MDSYDDIPYDSSPVTETDPHRLAVVARLFGVEAANPERCRVLELGCAAGGNLLPLAWRNPRSQYVGIELSGRQVADGRRLIDRLDLGNVEIRQGDILDLGDELGGFDYILCHGVYSWVPGPVREKILDLCATRLNPKGIAYVSYNTLPGWRQKGMLRDMLLYHTRDAGGPGERLEQARDFLDFILKTTAGTGAFHERQLKQQIARIRETHPSYLYHEYLEAINDPCLFSDFMGGAEARGLAYLADTDLYTMFPSTLGDEVEAALEGIDDAVKQEQYLDFVRNRNFRQTLLCRGEALKERVMDLERFETFGFFADLAPPKKVELRRRKAQLFRRLDGEEISVGHPLTRAALVHLGQAYPDALSWDEISGVAQAAVAAAGGQGHAAELDHLFGELFSLFLHQAIGVVVNPGTLPRGGDRPRINSLGRAQVEHGLAHMATPRHTTLTLDPLAARLVSLLDGSRDFDGVVAAMLDQLEREPALHSGWAGVSGNPDKLRARVRANCQSLMAIFARQGVFA